MRRGDLTEACTILTLDLVKGAIVGGVSQETIAYKAYSNFKDADSLGTYYHYGPSRAFKHRDFRYALRLSGPGS